MMLFGGLIAAIVPVLLIAFLAVISLTQPKDERGEMLWVIIPVSITMLVHAIVGGLIAAVFGIVWLGAILVLGVEIIFITLKTLSTHSTRH